MSATASSVSAALRRGGLRPVATRNREGVRVTSSVVGVYVTADCDRPSEARRLADEAYTILRASGYGVDQFNAYQMRVTR